MGATSMGWYNWPVCRLTICAHIMRRVSCFAKRLLPIATGSKRREIAGNVERRQQAKHVVGPIAQADCRQVFHIPSNVARMQGCPDMRPRHGIASQVPLKRSAGSTFDCVCQRGPHHIFQSRPPARLGGLASSLVWGLASELVCGLVWGLASEQPGLV